MMSRLRGSVWQLACDPSGCRDIQQALTVLAAKDAAQLVAELHGHVAHAVVSPHANHVVQKVVEVMTPAAAAFVAEELVGRGMWASRHRFGCRIVCRLLEHFAFADGAQALVDEILANTESLCRDRFGHYVAQSVLEHGLARQRHKVWSVLCEDLLRNASHRNASYVLQRCLTHCSAEDQRALAGRLLGAVAPLAQTPSGCNLVRALWRHPDAGPGRVGALLRPAAGQLCSTRHGSQLLGDLGLRDAAGPPRTEPPRIAAGGGQHGGAMGGIVVVFQAASAR